MERIYYSRQNYNQLKRKQYEEYKKKQNRYYLYRKKYYEEYIKRQNRYYLYKKKQYEEYVKKQNRYYLYKKKYYEEYLRRQNRYYLYKKKYDQINTVQRFFLNPIKTSNIESNYIKDHNIKSMDGYLEANIGENNLEYKKDNSDQYAYLENKSCASIKDPYNEVPLEEVDDEFIEEIVDEFIEEIDDESIEEIDEEVSEEIDEALLSENCKVLMEGNDEKFIEKSDKELIEEIDEKFTENRDKEFLDENYTTSIKEELSKKNNIFIEGVYVKFPVILAETNITITVEDTITLNEEIKEIKEIRKNVFLTQSRLIPFSSSTIDPNSGILFINGFIRNSIEYETQTYTSVETVSTCGDIKHCTFEVPFNFTTRISFLRAPIFIKNTITSELEFVNDSNQIDDIYANSVIGCNPCEQCLMFTEVFNDNPFVELVKATFIEVDINKNLIFINESIPEEKITKITEKIIVNLILRVLQKQQLIVEIE